MEAKVRNLWRSGDSVVGTLESRKLRHLTKLLNPVPSRQFGHLILPDNPDQSRFGELFAGALHRIERVADPLALNLPVEDFKAWIVGDREAEQSQTIGRGSLSGIRSQRSLSRWHEEKPIKTKLLESILCRDQVSQVDRVKAAAKKSEFQNNNSGAVSLAQ